MEFQAKGYEDMELSTQILIREALARDIRVDILDRKENFIRMRKDGKTEYIRQATRTAADSYMAALIMENKLVTKEILRESGIRVPAGMVFPGFAEAVNSYDKWRMTGVVVKPNTTNFGTGVHILKAGFSRQEFANSLKTAFSHDNSVIVEEFAAGREYRFLVIGGETVAVLYRVPANITGDGKHTVRELVRIKNRDPLRGRKYVRPLEKIKLGTTERDFLAGQGFDISHVPGEGETLFLRNNSNISTGGDSIDVTDEIPQAYKTIAAEAAAAVGAKICGADIIIKDWHDPPYEDNYAVIELNFNPALHIHCFPYRGSNRHPEKKLLDLLGFRHNEGAAADRINRYTNNIV